MPAVSVSSLEDVSIQKIHKQIGVISLPPAVRTDGTRWNKQKLIQEFGFPVLSKEIARKIELLQNPTPNKYPMVSDFLPLSSDKPLQAV